jgi:hypothetical protein
MSRTLAPEREALAGQGDTIAEEWRGHFQRLSEHLGFKVNSRGQD